jgi:ParB/RepB/Spo0J family partition protein
MKSFKAMIKDGEIKRADAMKARLEDLHEEPGFNLRAEGEDLEQSISDLAEFIAAGGQIPALEVRPRAEGGLWLVDGHRRSRALRRLDAEGRLPRVDGEAWVAIVAFTGNDADRVARVITSQEGRKLSPLELAEGYKRLAAFGWTTEQIGKAVGKTRQHVDQMMVLAGANTDVQQMVKAGTVSAATAVELVREHGEDAGKVLATELEKAKAQGKAKVTGGTMKGPSVPRSLLDDLHAESTKLHQALSSDDHAMLEAFHRGSIDGGTIAVPVERLLHLHLVLEEAQRVLDEKNQRAQEKANKAKQQELEVQA